MKNLHLLLVYTAIVICSCIHQVDHVVWNYSIVNNSGKTIELIPFFRDGKDISRKIVIANGNKLEKKIVTENSNYGILMQDVIANGDGSVRGFEIVFDNKKKITYDQCYYGVCDNPRNIFDKSHSSNPIETYIFTVTDYENATDCGGDCN